MKVTYLGTTTLLFDDGADQLLFDCHVTRPSIPKFLFGRLATDAAVADRVIRDFELRRLRGIFVSHAHHDHVLDAPYFALRCASAVYGSPSALNVARGGGVAEERLHSFAGRSDFSIGDFRVRAIPSIHSRPHWYNDDLGQTIDAPLAQPARRRGFREGGSFDFLIAHRGRQFLIRPSYNFIPGQLDGLRADALFLGVAGLAGDDPARRDAFFAETVDKVRPEIVVPVHWDNFFAPLYGDVRGMPRLLGDSGRSLGLLARHCAQRGIPCAIQPPLSTLRLFEDGPSPVSQHI